MEALFVADRELLRAIEARGLATALGGECATIILNPFRGIQVMAPSAFWKGEAERGQRPI